VIEARRQANGYRDYDERDLQVVAELDVDINPRTAQAAGVLGMPTLNLYVGGRVATQVVGARPRAALLRAIGDHLPITTG
jgi:thioredoxin 1